MPEALDVEAIAARLGEVRERTLELIGTLDWEVLRHQHVPILSPMIWDLGHIGNFEEIWLVRRLAAEPPVEPEFERMFDAVGNPRPTRASLPLPSGKALLDYLKRVRRRALAVASSGPDAADPRLLRDDFVYELAAQHEEQHQETLLQAMQILDDPPYVPPRRRAAPPSTRPASGMVEIVGGPFAMGAAEGGFAYDNERPRHRVTVGDFRIDRHPVTQGEFVAFVEEGGYRRDELWSHAGRQWRDQTAVEAPANWRRVDGEWRARFMDCAAAPPSDRPVVHVSYHEAEAYARWVGKRLPTEAEWEKAALWDASSERSRLFPWGDGIPTAELANVDQVGFEPAPVGAYPKGASYYGVCQMVGDVWEWTSSDFTGYPSFEAFPYAEYSEIFFGDEYKVLRGGSWATRPRVARGTFRNWDYPIRRQIFAGFRCAADPD